jgi:hypothetical protein
MIFMLDYIKNSNQSKNCMSVSVQQVWVLYVNEIKQTIGSNSKSVFETQNWTCASCTGGFSEASRRWILLIAYFPMLFKVGSDGYNCKFILWLMAYD